MTSLNDPEAIRHFQSICDACQELISKYHRPEETRMYADGYLHALRKCQRLERNELEKLELLIDKWILDPSSFIGPNGDISSLFVKRDFDQ